MQVFQNICFFKMLYLGIFHILFSLQAWKAFTLQMFWKRSYWNPLTRIWVFKFLFKARKRRTEGLWVFQKHFVHD